MVLGKGEYLSEITAGMKMPSQELGRNLEGSTPPSVFIGSWNYPRVYAGPLITPIPGDTSKMDTPETWIAAGTSQEEIIGYRMNLVRGKKCTDVRDSSSRFAEQLQEIALSATSADSRAAFDSAPRGVSFSDEHTCFGPSASLVSLHTDPVGWDRDLERVFYDTDLNASDALMDLHRRGLSFSSIQKAFSTGIIGIGRKRRLVPTRWSITACDSTIGERLIKDIRRNPVIDTIRVHEFDSLHNHYAVLLLPTAWQYEWMEAFLRILGNEELVFSDHEGYRGKKEYSRVGGCFYSCRMAVLEALHQQQSQAGAIILREAYRGYVPLGVFNVRENVRQAMKQPACEFEDVRAALGYISDRLSLPISRFLTEGTLLREVMRGGQMRLSQFA
jgi:hypothetical protein